MKLELPLRVFTDNNKYIKIDGEGYLLGCPNDNDIYLIDLSNNNYTNFRIDPPAVSNDNIFRLSNSTDGDEVYFTDYVSCRDAIRTDC